RRRWTSFWAVSSSSWNSRGGISGRSRTFSASTPSVFARSTRMPKPASDRRAPRFSAVLRGACGIAQFGEEPPEIGCWLGVPFWGRGYATEAARAVIDYAFDDLGYDVMAGGARGSNPASRRVLGKCGFHWTGVGPHRFRALASSAPVDRFRLDRRRWAIVREDGRERSWAQTGGASLRRV